LEFTALAVAFSAKEFSLIASTIIIESSRNHYLCQLITYQLGIVSKLDDVSIAVSMFSRKPFLLDEEYVKIIA